MKFVSTTNVKDVTLDGVDVEFDVTGTTPNAVTIRDMYGNLLRVRYTSYAIAAEVLAPPEMKKVWRVSGTLNDAAFAKEFEGEWEAKDYARDYESKGFEVNIVADEVPA